MKGKTVMKNTVKNTAGRNGGFTLVEIMIVVAIIGLLAAMAIPNFVRARDRAQLNACINNLRLIDSAKQQWALEQHQSGDSVPTGSALQPYLGHGSAGELPNCPATSSTNFDDSYAVNSISTPPTCKVNAAHALP